MNRDWITGMISDRTVLVSTFVLVIMIGSVFTIPWLFYDPYYEPEQVRVTHESTDAFNVTVAAHDISTEDAIAMDDLSPTAQELVRRTIADGKPVSAVNSREDGDWKQSTIYFCRESMPVCDKYESRPSELNFGYGLTVQEVYDVIEIDGELYLFETGSTTIADFGPWTAPGSIILVLGFYPTIAVLSLVTLLSWNSNPTVVRSVAGLGFVLTMIGVIGPLLEMYTGFPISYYQTFGVVIIWVFLLVSLLASASYWVVRIGKTALDYA